MHKKELILMACSDTNKNAVTSGTCQAPEANPEKPGPTDHSLPLVYATAIKAGLSNKELVTKANEWSTNVEATGYADPFEIRVARNGYHNAKDGTAKHVLQCKSCAAGEVDWKRLRKSGRQREGCNPHEALMADLLYKYAHQGRVTVSNVLSTSSRWMKFQGNQHKVAELFAIAESWNAGTIEGKPKEIADDAEEKRGGPRHEPLTLRMHLSHMDADSKARFFGQMDLESMTVRERCDWNGMLEYIPHPEIKHRWGIQDLRFWSLMCQAGAWIKNFNHSSKTKYDKYKGEANQWKIGCCEPVS